METREFDVADAAALRAFWELCGITIRPGDDDRSLESFAARNLGLFLVAVEEGGIVASALGAWDGRRGWLQHVAMRPDQRRHSHGSRPMAMIEERLRALGCLKINLILWDDHTAALDFWSATGYARKRTVEYGRWL